MDKTKIAILTTVANFELYAITSKLFPKGIKKYVIDGRNGMHGIYSIFFMFRKLKKKNIDWLILADEDVIFIDENPVFSIIEKMTIENISVAGVRDGGLITHRNYNPEALNTFFTIINFKEISAEWNQSEVKKHQYILPNEFKINDTSLNGLFDMNSLYEPYYCFFFWLKRKGKKFLYLDAEMLDDISNNIKFNNKSFAIHTWYARSYNINNKHTARINKILNELKIPIKPNHFEINEEIFKDTFFFFKMKFKKLFKRIKNKISENHSHYTS